ncbi:MAG TPA: hypothetical protein V6C72_07880, partial [Chroococcales cyanobacterium]
QYFIQCLDCVHCSLSRASWSNRDSRENAHSGLPHLPIRFFLSMCALPFEPACVSYSSLLRWIRSARNFVLAEKNRLKMPLLSLQRFNLGGRE